MKFACGTASYEKLLKANFPFPAVRTLTQKLENLEFKSGIISEIFQFLKIKISGFTKEIDKDCTLVLDEMSILPLVIFTIDQQIRCLTMLHYQIMTEMLLLLMD